MTPPRRGRDTRCAVAGAAVARSRRLIKMALTTLDDGQVPCSGSRRQRVRLETEQPTGVVQVPWIAWPSSSVVRATATAAPQAQPPEGDDSRAASHTHPHTHPHQHTHLRPGAARRPPAGRSHGCPAGDILRSPGRGRYHRPGRSCGHRVEVRSTGRAKSSDHWAAARPRSGDLTTTGRPLSREPCVLPVTPHRLCRAQPANFAASSPCQH